MVRISDCRMSGTAFGTIILHATPEAAIGGPLALVKTGDMIRLDVPARQLEMLVEADEIERRRAAWVPPETINVDRGYKKLYMDQVNQADEGVDFAFMTKRPFVTTTPQS